MAADTSTTAAYIYLAHCDFLANCSNTTIPAATPPAATPTSTAGATATPAPAVSPTAIPAPSATPTPDPLENVDVLVAFNLISVIPRGNPPQDPTDFSNDSLMPWKVLYTGGNPVDFLLLTRKSKPAGNGKIDDGGFTLTPLGQSLNVNFKPELAKACEGIFHAHDAFGGIERDKDDSKVYTAPDRTWSSILAGASQQGDPLSSGLGLVHWFDRSLEAGTALKAADVIGDDMWCAVIPETLVSKTVSLSRSDWTYVEHEQSLTVTYEGKNHEEPLALRVNVLRLTAAKAADDGTGSSAALALSSPFVGTPRTINAGTFTNWLGSLAHELGNYLDLLWIAQSQLTTSDQGKKPAGIQQVEAAIALFHEHADLGLRPILHAEAGPKDERDYTDSLAYELFVQILRARPNGDPNAEGKLRTLFSRSSDQQPTADDSIWKPGASLDDAEFLYGVAAADKRGRVLQPWTSTILLKALERVDGALNQARSHSGAYDNLRTMLRFYLWDPSSTPGKPPKGDVTLTVDSDTLKLAYEELVHFAEDENALLEMFCLQWNRLLVAKTDVKWVVALRQLLPPAKDGDDPIGVGDREALRNYLQAGSIRLSQRYSDALAAVVQTRMAGCVAGASYNLMVEYSRSATTADAQAGFRDASTAGNVGVAPTGTAPTGFPGFLRECWNRVRVMDYAPLVLLPREHKVLQAPENDLEKSALQKRINPEKASICSQHLEAATYLGAALLEYRKWVVGQTAQSTNECQSARLLTLKQFADVLPEAPFTTALVDTLCGSDPNASATTRQAPSPKSAATPASASATSTPGPLVSPSPAPANGNAVNPPANAAQENGNGRGRDSKKLKAYWKTFPWVNRLVGSDGMQTPVPTPPALPVPLLTQQEYDPRRYSGMLILARRLQDDAETDWWIVNVGRPGYIARETSAALPTGADKEKVMYFEHLDHDVRVHRANGETDTPGKLAVPASWQIVESFGVTQNVIEYRGELLGVRLRHALPDEPYSNTEHVATAGAEPTTSRPLDLVREDFTDDDQHEQEGHHHDYAKDEDEHAHPSVLGWGAVPGLRYGSAWKYQFLFVPIHNTGALPWDFRNISEKSPCALWSATSSGNVNQLPNSVAKNAEKSMVTVTGYLRRVPIGQVRLAEVVPSPKHADPPKATDLLKARFKPFKSTPKLDDVQPMYADLQEQGAYEYLSQLVERDPKRDATGKIIVVAPPQNLPARTILLYNGKSDDKSKLGKRSDEVSFRIRPPATAFENWAISQWSQAGDPPNASIQHLIADTRHLVHELSATGNPTAKKSEGLELTQLLDDSAIGAVQVRLSEVLCFCGSSFVQRSTQLIEFEPPGAYSAGENASDIEVKRAILDVVQRAGKKTVHVSLTNSQSAEMTADDSTVSITVPHGCIVQIELIPCVEKTLFESEFGIYQDFRELVKGPDKREWYPIPESGFRIWVEGAPGAPGLPEEGDVWDALRLGRVGSFGKEANVVERLEVAVQPPSKGADADLALLRKWALVSEVEVAIQPWSWRGLPESGYESLAVLRKTATDAQGHSAIDPDAEHRLLRALTEAEAPSFNEVPPAVAEVRSHPINYAASLYVSQTPVAEGAIIFKSIKDEIALLPLFIVYQDRGTQDEIPRYYRVRLTVKSRYAGLLGLADEFRKVMSNGAFPAIMATSQGEKSEPAFNTTHKRILFGGKLPRRLDLPRVKMVIPLLEAADPTGDGGAPKTRPGFIVLTRGPLASPWHRLIAEVDWARVTIGDPDGDPVVKELPEFGPDPITASEGFDWSFMSISELKQSSSSDGAAFGLTYERETGLPGFPNAGFYFAPPFASPLASSNPETSKDAKPVAGSPAAITGDDARHDWFAKMRFHWEMRPPYVMDTQPDWLVSESTQPWQVRLLAPFDAIAFDGDRSGGPAPLAGVRLGPETDEGIPTFRRSGKAGAPLGRPRPPIYDTGGRPSRGSDPKALLLFVAWKFVPDFLTAEHSKVVYSITAFPTASEPIRIHRNENSGKDAHADGGNFLLLFGREEEVSRFATDKSLNLDNGLDRLLGALFPGSKCGTNERVLSADEDAKMMITRCSEPILARD